MKEHLRRRLLQIFEAEHAEHVDAIRQQLELSEPKALDEALRRAHSLKGAARAVDMPLVEKLAHQLETLFARLRAGAASLDGETRGLVQRVLDRCEDLVAAELQGRPEADPGPELAELQVWLGIAPQPADPSPVRSAPAVPDAELPQPTAKAPRPDALPDALPEGLQRPQAEAAAESEPVPLIQIRRADSSEAAAEPLPEDGEAADRPREASSGGLGQSMRVSSQRFEALLESSDRLQAESRQQDEMEALCAELGEQINALTALWDARRQHPDALETGMNSGLQQLARLGRRLRQGQRQSSWQLAQEVRTLQHDIRAIRMLPARELFQTFPKMLRALAREQGKQVECRFGGLEIEADRAVLQAIKDPVMHILRNAIAHGIETPAQRQAAGKPVAGQIDCQLEVRGNELAIRIRDDGPGLDRERVRKASAAAGLGPGSDWREGIFAPGFSTATGVDALRGRGMGLSVVAETVTRLQGNYRLLPGPGFGIELVVPLHLATTHLLLVRVKDRLFGVPTAAVTELRRVKPEAFHSLEGQPALMHGGEPWPCQDLGLLLGLGPRETGARGREGPVSMLLLHSGNQRLALVVDALLAEREVVLKPLSGPAAELPAFLGAALTAAGRPIPVLDPHALVALPRRQVSAPVAEPEPPLILVVDDSITTRTLEQSILEAHGFRVKVAVNGLDALELLQHEPFDLVITDVQMPEMDGLELLASIKADPALAATPVIVVTSLYEDADRRRGLELGASAYLVKQKFEQQELLDVIAQLL